MPVTAADIQLHYSGGPNNANPHLSLGGPISTYTIAFGEMNNLFDNVTEIESGTGDTEYRCVYVRNNHPTSSLENAIVWIAQDTPSADDEVDIGVDGSGVNGEAPQVADESTAPPNVVFSHPTSKSQGLQLGTLGPGQWRAIWLRRTVQPGAAPYSRNSVVIGVAGATA